MDKAAFDFLLSVQSVKSNGKRNLIRDEDKEYKKKKLHGFQSTPKYFISVLALASGIIQGVIFI